MLAYVNCLLILAETSIAVPFATHTTLHDPCIPAVVIHLSNLQDCLISSPCVHMYRSIYNDLTSYQYCVHLLAVMIHHPLPTDVSTYINSIIRIHPEVWAC